MTDSPEPPGEPQQPQYLPAVPAPPIPPKQPSWWSRQSTKTKAGIIIGVVVVLALFGATAEEPADEPASKERTTTERQRDAAPKPAKPKDPIATLTADVEKNAVDQVGTKRVKDVECAPEGRVVQCRVEYRLGAMWDADDNEVARDVGGMVEELFRDTDVQYLHVRALTDTVDPLGNETKDDDVAWIIIRRAGWEKVNWKNLQHQEPIDGLRNVAEVYADTLSS